MVGVAARSARRLLLLAGERAWGQRWVTGRVDEAARRDTLWVADDGPPDVEVTPPARVVDRLGGECRLLIFDAHGGFHPDAFAAAVGGLRGGGDCVVLAPPLSDWPGFDDPDRARFAGYPRTMHDMRGGFLSRLARLWHADPAVVPVTPDAGVDLRLAPAAGAAFRLSADQQQVVAAVERVALGHARRPLVLTADRGRGKSTALGVAAAGLLSARLSHITVVAPHRAAAETLFRHACACAGVAFHRVSDIPIGGGTLCFRLPADLGDDDPGDPGLVLVDEAAALPVAVLAGLVARHNRLVFASTVHGYEGSGRGFEIRFTRVLERAMPQWRALQLTTPVRWGPGDPLEALVDRSFLLDTEPPEVAEDGRLEVDRVETASLVTDEPLLRAVFGLLVSAHYQTRPSDLRQLLDNPDVYLWLARRGGAVCGVLLGVREGGFDADMAERILTAQRRPRGHLLAQSLAVHAGLDEAVGQDLLRVQRIAVHSRLQRQGIGRALLTALANWAVTEDIDALGCAFGAERPLVRFWQACGFLPMRLGVRVDPASAAYSLFMLRGLSASGCGLAELGRQRFQGQLPWALAAALSTLDSGLAAGLLRGRDCTDLALSPRDLRDLERVAAGARPAATADALLWKRLVWMAAEGVADTEVLAPLVAWRLQRWSVERVCRVFGFAGGRSLEARLQAAIGQARTPVPTRG